MAEVPIIAVVDDDIGIREALEGLIQSLGFRAALFKSAEDFLAFAGDSLFACVVVDMRLPGLSGLEFQTLLNQHCVQTPVIFLTSYTDEIIRVRALEGGARYFLAKPIGDDVLADCFRELIT